MGGPPQSRGCGCGGGTPSLGAPETLRGQETRKDLRRRKRKERWHGVTGGMGMEEHRAQACGRQQGATPRLGKGQSRASCAGFPEPGGMAQAQAGKVKGPLRTALFLTQGVGNESSKFQRKDEGAFWELGMGDLPRDKRVKTINLVFPAEQAWIPMGIDRRLIRGTG